MWPQVCLKKVSKLCSWQKKEDFKMVIIQTRNGSLLSAKVKKLAISLLYKSGVGIVPVKEANDDQTSTSRHVYPGELEGAKYAVQNMGYSHVKVATSSRAPYVVVEVQVTGFVIADNITPHGEICCDAIRTPGSAMLYRGDVFVVQGKDKRNGKMSGYRIPREVIISVNDKIDKERK